MASVFDLLDEVRKRPAMYLGGDNTEPIVQLGNLELLLSGYSLALRQHGIVEAVSDFNRELAAYLWKTKGWSPSCGPVSAMRDAVSASEVWDLYWRCVDEFRVVVEERKPA